jgi:hypothetical protein
VAKIVAKDMAKFGARVPKMAMRRVFIPTPSRSAHLLLRQNSYKEDVGYMAGLSHRNIINQS